MGSHSFIWLGAIVGSTLGGFVPSLWGAGMFSMSSVIFTAIVVRTFSDNETGIGAAPRIKFNKCSVFHTRLLSSKSVICPGSLFNSSITSS